MSVSDMLGTTPLRAPTKSKSTLGNPEAQIAVRLRPRPHRFPPVFFRITLRGRRRRVLDLEPVADASRPIMRAKRFGHDAFAAARAGMPEDGHAGEVWRARSCGPSSGAI